MTEARGAGTRKSRRPRGLAGARLGGREIADQAALSDPALEGPAAAVRDALDDVIIANHTQPQVAFSSGLTIFADTSLRRWVRDYREGPWATTAWDELLYEAGSSLQNAQ